MAVYLLFFKKSKIVTHKELDITDNLVYIGWAFLSLGMLTGALWAKDAWGLLGLGPERNLGSCHLAGLSYLYSLPLAQEVQFGGGYVDTHRELCAPANVLVGH